MLVLYNVKMVPLNVRKKKKRTTECDKNIVTCDIVTAQCEDGTIKCEKKIKEPLNVTKVQSYVKLVLRNVKIVPSNARKKKKKREPPNMTKI